VREHRLADRSPIANTLATLVRICRSTSMKPRSVTAMPAAAALILFPFGLRPTDTSTRSNCVRSGDDLPSKLACRPSGFASTFATLVPRCTATPRFFSRSASGFTRSGSVPGISWSMNSTTVMRLPSEAYTQAISRPMMPPPTTSSSLGTSASCNASVESITRGSSQGKAGSFTGCEPAATMHCPKAMRLLPPR
jgi:hypothetical protein